MMRKLGPAPLFYMLCFSALLTACSDNNGGDASLFSAAMPEEMSTPPAPPAAEVCVLPESDIEVQTTSDNIEFVRTPDSCFENLDNFDYAPNYAMIDGLRMHYVDEGPRDGELILLLHGQPSWSYLYRKMIPRLSEAGFRVIALDHMGMGRSDKPLDPRVHVYEQHVQWLKDFIDAEALNDITLFAQDWGSLIGLRTAGDMPERFARIVIANGDLAVVPDGLNPFVLPSFEIDETQPADAFDFFSNRTGARIESFQQWVDYAAGVPELIAADVIQLSTIAELRETETASYNAPFPSFTYKAAIRAFPSMVTGFDSRNQPAFDALGEFEKPFLFLGGDFDRNLGSVANQRKWINHVPGAAGQFHDRFPAGHFIQDDVGEQLAEAVISFVSEGQANLRRTLVFGYEVLQPVAPDEFIVWITPFLTQEEFDAIELPAGWIRNQPRESQSDGGGFARSPDAAMDGPLTVAELFGHSWRHVATVTSLSTPVGDDGLLSSSTVNKFHEVNFNVGRTIFVLVSPEGEEYIRISRDRNRTAEVPSTPTGWQLQKFRVLEPLMLSLPFETTVLRVDNQDSFQGPVDIPEASVERL